MVTIGDKLIEVIIVCLALVNQQLGQCARQIGFAASTVLQEAFCLLDQFGLALVGDDQAGIIFSGSELYLPVECRGFGA